MERIAKFRIAIQEIMEEYTAERRESYLKEGVNFEIIADEKGPLSITVDGLVGQRAHTSTAKSGCRRTTPSTAPPIC
jgi:hypothetical protein